MPRGDGRETRGTDTEQSRAGGKTGRTGLQCELIISVCAGDREGEEWAQRFNESEISQG